MSHSRTDYKRFKSIGEEFSVDFNTIKSVVNSFFDTIYLSAKSLPFNNPRRIYGQDKFNELTEVFHIPGIGRIGPVYSRYIKWRVNEAPAEQRLRESYSTKLTQDEIEHIAAEALAGRTPFIKKNKYSDLFSRVWLIGTDGKRQAKQVIPKKKDNV